MAREPLAAAAPSPSAEQALTEAVAAKDAAYAERNQVVALVARMALSLGWRAGLRSHEPDPDPTWDHDWKNVVAIDLPSGQVTWHYHDSDRPLFASLPPYPAAWDSHDTAEKYRRVNAALASAEQGAREWNHAALLEADAIRVESLCGIVKTPQAYAGLACLAGTLRARVARGEP